MSENTFKVGDLVYYIEDQELKWGRIIKIATLFEDTYYKIHEQGQYYYFTTKDVIFPITIPTWDLLSYMQERDIMLASYAHYCNIKEQKEFAYGDKTTVGTTDELPVMQKHQKLITEL